MRSRYALLVTLLLACASDASRLLDASRADLPYEKDASAPEGRSCGCLSDAAQRQAEDALAGDAAGRRGPVDVSAPDARRGSARRPRPSRG